MAYVKQDFQAGEILTAEALNAMDEQVYQNSQTSGITEDNITTALGYTPADKNTVDTQTAEIDNLKTVVEKNTADIDELNTKIVIENKTVTINAGEDYSYISYKTGYVLSAVHGTTFNGVYTTGIADTGSNYAVFFNTRPVAAADITLSLTWVKI